ncbi:MAG TPA: hypothetical protein VK171_05460 [Fimbriimonas sp.]|nr:hypothetical protein [Fimbriimonas sp.]
MSRYSAAFTCGTVEIDLPDSKGLRNCYLNGAIIGIIKTLENGRHEIAMKQGKPRNGQFRALWMAAGVILGSHDHYVRQAGNPRQERTCSVCAGLLDSYEITTCDTCAEELRLGNGNIRQMGLEL